MTVSEDLTSWAARNKAQTAQAALALQVAAALENDAESTKWSLIDVRREFEARAGESGSLLTALGALSALTFILPVLVAWVHLRGVFSEFRDAVRVAGNGEQINFLAFWTGAYEGRPWAYSGTTASTVAFQVIVAVLLVIALQAVIGALETRGAARDRALDDLITSASLQFARKRAVRPEELAGEIRVAALELERGLKNLSVAFENTRALVKEVEGFAGVITKSSEKLDESSRTLATTMAPLSEFSKAAQNAERALAMTVASLESAEKAFAEGVKGNAEALAGARSMLTSGVKESTAAIGAVTSGVESAAAAVARATDGLASVVDSSIGVSSSVAGTVRELDKALEAVRRVASEMGSVSQTTANAATTLSSVAASADSPQVQSYVLAVQDVTSELSRSAKEMVTAVQHMSEQLQRWTADAQSA
jgi:ABC-type transporter Mla subunit MlaD